ncbi:MAG: hypothetical protein RJB66_306 [Pseudomonadota bacterium]|jgi:GNAT superfamily N-acetyltransferase
MGINSLNLKGMLQPRFTYLNSSDLTDVKTFTDQWIGKGYFSLEELKDILSKSIKSNLTASLIARIGVQVVGVRLSLAPNSWIEPGLRIATEKWGVPIEKVGYFKSLFVAEEFRGRGLGRRLSQLSKEILVQQGSSAIVTHSWLESPGNSSQEHLLRQGFVEVARYEKFWETIDYQCSRCSPRRCLCTAVEMILKL